MGGIVGALWAVSIIALNAALNAGRLVDPAQVIAGVVCVALIGTFTIWVHSRYLRAADEFIRKMETESLALAFGLAIISSVALWQLTSAGIITDWRASRYFGSAVFPAMAVSRLLVFFRYR